MRSKLIVVVAILALGVGLFGLYNNLGTSKRSVDEVAQADVPVKQTDNDSVTVWRLTSSVERGDKLESHNLVREQMSLPEALDNGIRSDVDIKFNATTLYNTSIGEGQLLLPEYLTNEADPGYIDLLVSEGMTLYPLTVSNKNLVSDYIRPGERIDILTVSSPRTNLAQSDHKKIGFKGVAASLFLRNVKVLSIGKTDDEARVKATAEPSAEGYTTVIIEIPPEEVARLALAQRTMHLEVYRTLPYEQEVYADVTNVMDNYFGIEELRGSNKNSGSRGEL